ncbi:hypothetical protein Hanom_Chr06g00571741 [Helianthus anomalus]
MTLYLYANATWRATVIATIAIDNYVVNMDANPLKNCEKRLMRLEIYAYLIKPIRVKNLKTTQLPASAFFSNRSLAALEFQLCDTLVCGLSVHNTLGNGSLTPTTPHTYSIDYITLPKINIKIKRRLMKTLW